MKVSSSLGLFCTVLRSSAEISSRLAFSCGMPSAPGSPSRRVLLARPWTTVSGYSSSRWIWLTWARARATRRSLMTFSNRPWVRCCTSSCVRAPANRAYSTSTTTTLRTLAPARAATENWIDLSFMMGLLTLVGIVSEELIGRRTANP
ncbi:Uncharacterised protein [Acinetobacter baumannii]|nr:Uncharacterised protein [Acinetobacter baumannii]